MIYRTGIKLIRFVQALRNLKGDDWKVQTNIPSEDIPIKPDIMVQKLDRLVETYPNDIVTFVREGTDTVVLCGVEVDNKAKIIKLGFITAKVLAEWQNCIPESAHCISIIQLMKDTPGYIPASVLDILDVIDFMNPDYIQEPEKELIEIHRNALTERTRQVDVPALSAGDLIDKVNDIQTQYINAYGLTVTNGQGNQLSAIKSSKGNIQFEFDAPPLKDDDKI